MIQGHWDDTASVAEGDAIHYFTFEDTSFHLAIVRVLSTRTSGDNYFGNIEITRDGKLILTDNTYGRDYIIYYEYDENTDTITLVYEGNVLEQS